jgi:hypothetical protein
VEKIDTPENFDSIQTMGVFLSGKERLGVTEGV